MSARARQQHRLGRSIRSLAIGVQTAREQRTRMNDLVRGAERIEELQQQIEGEAGGDQAVTTYNVKFEHVFVGEANGRRQADLQRPQLMGAEVEWTRLTDGDGATTSLMPWIQLAVKDWTIDEHLTVVGCRLAVGVVLPGAPVGAVVKFRGFVHLTFHGYGSPDEQPDEDE